MDKFVMFQGIFSKLDVTGIKICNLPFLIPPLELNYKTRKYKLKEGTSYFTKTSKDSKSRYPGSYSFRTPQPTE
ncbi:Microtubule-Actin Cross-Linking Factor 1, Isoforms 1/2/3/5 [Manis pentadactyla]|nr:Microtubule-Actin Cross-Linking Factor 1, Isoforms 1/2/3/5 [Manis pentadactyla]